METQFCQVVQPWLVPWDDRRQLHFVSGAGFLSCGAHGAGHPERSGDSVRDGAGAVAGVRVERSRRAEARRRGPCRQALAEVAAWFGLSLSEAVALPFAARLSSRRSPSSPATGQAIHFSQEPTRVKSCRITPNNLV